MEPEKIQPGEGETVHKPNKFKRLFTKKRLIWLVILLAVITGGWLGCKKFFRPKPKHIYEVAVMARSQNNPDPVEDKRTSLKAGDVLIVKREGHNWSRTEEISYLILKMELTEEQADKLMRPEEKEIKFKDLPEEEQQRIEEEKQRAKKEGREYFEEPRREILTTREYHIDLQKHFPDFKPLDLLDGQPYQGQIYDWGIVDKK